MKTETEIRTETETETETETDKDLDFNSVRKTDTDTDTNKVIVTEEVADKMWRRPLGGIPLEREKQIQKTVEKGKEPQPLTASLRGSGSDPRDLPPKGDPKGDHRDLPPSLLFSLHQNG